MNLPGRGPEPPAREESAPGPARDEVTALAQQAGVLYEQSSADEPPAAVGPDGGNQSGTPPRRPEAQAQPSGAGQAPARPSRIRMRSSGPPLGEPAPGRPAITRPRMPDPYLSLETQTRAVFVRTAAFGTMREHSRSSANEVGGFLIGTTGTDAGGDFTIVEEAYPALQARGARIALEIPPSAFAQAHERVDGRPGLSVIGWYHTHPGLSVFLSNYDQFLHQSFFNRPGQVAIVVDPKLGRGGSAGVFVGDETGAAIHPERPLHLYSLQESGPADPAPQSTAAQVPQPPASEEPPPEPEPEHQHQHQHQQEREEETAAPREATAKRSRRFAVPLWGGWRRRHRDRTARQAAMAAVGRAPALPANLPASESLRIRIRRRRPERPREHRPGRRTPISLFGIGVSLLAVLILLILTVRELPGNPGSQGKDSNQAGATLPLATPDRYPTPSPLRTTGAAVTSPASPASPSAPAASAAARANPGGLPTCTTDDGVTATIDLDRNGYVQVELGTTTPCYLHSLFDFVISFTTGERIELSGVAEKGPIQPGSPLRFLWPSGGGPSGGTTLSAPEKLLTITADDVLGPDGMQQKIPPSWVQESTGRMRGAG